MDYSKVASEIMSIRRFGNDPGVTISKRLLKKLGYPESFFRIIHVAGTNGKGSTASYTAAILRRAGYHVGLFTSPHLVDFRERICVDGQMISEEDVIRLYERIKELGSTPTMFDISFVMAMMYFKECGVDYAVIETGLGGRLDSTNSISRIPEVTVITSIGLDHTEVLGDTIAQITAEKAGIIKPGTKVVTGPLQKEAMDVILDVCEKNRVKDVVQVDINEDDLVFPKINAAMADTVIELLGLEVSDEIINSVFLDPEVFPGRGRLQMISEDPVFIVDGAHNPPAAASLYKTLLDIYPNDNYYFLIGALHGHDTKGVIGHLLPLAKGFFAVGVEDKRAYTAEEICDMITSAGSECSICESVSSGMAAGREAASMTGGVAVACGSLYLVGEILNEI